MSHPHEQHHRGHVHRHDSLRLGSTERLSRLSTTVHRIGRRRFLTELGRNTFAVAILGGVAAACSSGDGDDATTDPTGSPQPSGGSEPVGDGDDATTAPTGSPQPSGGSEPVGEDGSGSGGAGSSLVWSQVSLGSVSAYVLVRGNEAAVVDTGNPDSADEIGATLSTLGVTYDDVRHVVLTHRHGDHIGSLGEVLGRASSSAAYAGAGDIGDISSPTEIVAVGDGDDVFGLQVIETPGHTPGSISLLDVEIGLLVAGDALNGNADGSEIAGPNERFSTDMDTAWSSVAKLATYEFESAVFGHGNPVEAGAGELVAELASQL